MIAPTADRMSMPKIISTDPKGNTTKSTLSEKFRNLTVKSGITSASIAPPAVAMGLRLPLVLTRFTIFV